MTVISRSGWCPECKTHGRPKTGQQFVVVGSNGYHFYKAEHQSIPGYVPHFYRLIKTDGKTVFFERICAMHECGVHVYFSQKAGWKFTFNGQWKGGQMSIKDWNALVMAHGGKQLGYNI